MNQANAVSTPVDITGLLALIGSDGSVIELVPLAELDELNEIRQIVVDAGEAPVSYTGS